MLNQYQEADNAQRYDSQMQQRVVERAARLQQEDQDRLTVHQIVDAAGEVGLEPHYVQRAIAQVQAEQAIQTTTRQTAKRTLSPGRAEYQRFVTAMTAPMALGALAFLLKDVTTLAILLSLVVPIPLACFSGFLTGRKRVGFVTAILLVLALAPTMYHLGIHNYYATHLNENIGSIFEQAARSEGQQTAFFYGLLGTPLAGMLGLFGAWTRQRYLPHPLTADTSPTELTPTPPIQGSPSGTRQHRI